MFERLSQPIASAGYLRNCPAGVRTEKLPKRGKGSERRFATSREACPARTSERGARAADIDLKHKKVVDDLRINYPHFSFATRE
jgi:hypothetical protein